MGEACWKSFDALPGFDTLAPRPFRLIFFVSDRGTHAGQPLPLTLEVSLQTVDGALIFDFAHNVITNVYTSLSNVLVRLSPSAAVVQVRFRAEYPAFPYLPRSAVLQPRLSRFRPICTRIVVGPPTRQHRNIILKLPFSCPLAGEYPAGQLAP